MQTHVIQKQIIEVNSRNGESNFELLSSVCNLKVAPVIEEVFSEFSDDDMFIRIDRLEIDTGEISIVDFENVFPQKVQKALFKELSGYMLQEFKKPVQGSASIPSTEDRELEALLYFLETGSLPWWAAGTGEVDLQESLRRVLLSGRKDITGLFISRLDTEDSIKRIIYQFDDDLLLRLLSSLTDKEYLKVKEEYRVFFSLYNNEIFSAIAYREFRNALFELFFRYGRINNVYDKKDFLYFVLGGLLESIGVRIIPGDLQRHSGRDELTNLIQNLFERFMESEGISDSEYFYRAYRSKSTTIDTKSLLKRYSEDSLFVEARDTEGYVENAGLVILHPFIPRFFERLGIITKENEFVDRHSRWKAVHLLQYVAGSCEKTPEYFLILNKILCGLEINEPIEREIEISSQDKMESERLLKSVIKHWKVLKSTSTRGLRDSFLKRKGALVKEYDKWTLKVEKKTYDILIETLPWSISIIRLPWMKDIIFTQW